LRKKKRKNLPFPHSFQRWRAIAWGAMQGITFFFVFLSFSKELLFWPLRSAFLFSHIFDSVFEKHFHWLFFWLIWLFYRKKKSDRFSLILKFTLTFYIDIICYCTLHFFDE
jgi:hypothetical protein